MFWDLRPSADQCWGLQIMQKLCVVEHRIETEVQRKERMENIGGKYWSYVCPSQGT